jgi:hypothetical protein
VVHSARRTDRQALRRDGLAHDRRQLSERDLDGARALDVRAAAETIVLILLATVRVRLGRLLSAAQLRHEQIGRCPREEQTDDCMNDDVPAKRSHRDQDTRPGHIPQIGRDSASLEEGLSRHRCHPPPSVVSLCGTDRV